jgi:hypothetical protein
MSRSNATRYQFGRADFKRDKCATMTENESHFDDPAVRAAEVIALLAKECRPYLHEDDLYSFLFDCYWSWCETADPSDRRALLEKVSEILLNVDSRAHRWTGLLNPYLDPAGSVRLLLEPSFGADRIDEVLAPYRDRLAALELPSPRDMSCVLELAAEIRNGKR